MPRAPSGWRLLCLAFLLARPASAHLCEPTPEIQRAIEEAFASAPDGASFDERMAPLRELRQRFPGNLFVHVRYQDAIVERGIEGHLQEMAEEYLRLANEHGGDPFYLYLSGRVFEGRGTRRAIAILEQVLALDAGFAPAHRTLAEIYGSAAFHDGAKERAERRKFAAACPGSAIAVRPAPLPPHSTLFARLREGKRNPEEDSLPGEVQRALLQDEWRALRIRLFDWYPPREQRRALHDLQAEYWQAWSVLVRHYRKKGDGAQAEGLLAAMEERLLRLLRSRRATTFTLAARTVLGLRAEANQPERLRAALARLAKSLDEHPNAKRASELARVRAQLAARP